MTRLIVTRGLPGSGKTTGAVEWVAAEPGRQRVNRDHLRLMMYGKDRGLDHSQEVAVTSVSHAAVKALLAAGLDVIVDDTNLRARYVRAWRDLAASCGAEFRVWTLNQPLEECIRRDAARHNPVGEDVIRSLHSKFTRDGVLIPVGASELRVGKVVEERPDLPDAVIVDIDGTIAVRGDRDPYDMTKVSEDLPNGRVVDLVRLLRQHMQVIFMSGRDDSCRSDTETWLATEADRTSGEPVYMRATGDRRRDAIVKEELFDRNVRDQFNVRLVLDDRNQVVDMWRRIGLTCLQVADGDF